MATLCDNCNGQVFVPAVGTIKGVAFHFCSPECRVEFADFSKSVGHPMVIPVETCDELDSAPDGMCPCDGIAVADAAATVAAVG